MKSWTSSEPVRVILILLMFVGLTGCNEVDSSPRVDCQLSDIAVQSDLVGTVSASGDRVTGTVTVTCDGAGVSPPITFTGSAGWWNLVSIGPSDPATGVINVARPAESLGHSDIGTTKTVKLVVNAWTGGSEDKKIFPIPVRIE